MSFTLKENKKADFSIFVSNWLYREYLNKGYEKNYKVIMKAGLILKFLIHKPG